MRTPEQFAWDVLDSTEDERMDSLIDLIRARDAEVREGALAGFEWVYETSFEDTGPCMAHEHTEHDGTEYVTSECYFPFAKQTRHLRGPREPVPTDTDTRESTP